MSKYLSILQRYLFIILLIVITLHYFLNKKTIKNVVEGLTETNVVEEERINKCCGETEISTLDNLMSSVNLLNTKFDNLTQEFNTIQSEISNNTSRIDTIYDEYNSMKEQLSSSITGLTSNS